MYRQPAEQSTGKRKRYEAGHSIGPLVEKKGENKTEKEGKRRIVKKINVSTLMIA